MNRLVIYGSGGAGKSTLARATGLPHVEIDVLAFDRSKERPYQHVPLDELAAAFASAIDQPRWVVEGMHRDELTVAIPLADMFVWLDLPRRVIAARLLTRRGDRHGRHVRVRDELPFIVKTIRAHGRRRRHGARLAALATESGAEVVHLRSSRAVRRWLARSV